MTIIICFKRRNNLNDLSCYLKVLRSVANLYPHWQVCMCVQHASPSPVPWWSLIFLCSFHNSRLNRHIRHLNNTPNTGYPANYLIKCHATKPSFFFIWHQSVSWLAVFNLAVALSSTTKHRANSDMLGNAQAPSHVLKLLGQSKKLGHIINGF